MPPQEHVRERRGRGDDERMRRAHGEDLRPPFGTGSLPDGRLPSPPADHGGPGKDGRRLCRSPRLADGERRQRQPHRRRQVHPRSPHRRQRHRRRLFDTGKRHGLRRRAHRRGRQGLRLHRRGKRPDRQRLDRRTLFRGRKLPAGQGLHGGRIAVLRQLALRERRGRLDLRGALHRLAPQVVAAHRGHVLVFQRGQRLEPEQPPVQERRRAPGGAPQGLQVRQRRLHHVPSAEGLSR